MLEHFHCSSIISPEEVVVREAAVERRCAAASKPRAGRKERNVVDSRFAGFRLLATKGFSTCTFNNQFCNQLLGSFSFEEWKWTMVKCLENGPFLLGTRQKPRTRVIAESAEFFDRFFSPSPLRTTDMKATTTTAVEVAIAAGKLVSKLLMGCYTRSGISGSSIL